MAMNGAQTSGWAAGTGSTLTPEQLNVLILGSLAGFLLLFSAWSLVQAHRGVASGTVTWRQFIETAVRLIILYLITLFFFFH